MLSGSAQEGIYSFNLIWCSLHLPPYKVLRRESGSTNFYNRSIPEQISNLRKPLKLPKSIIFFLRMPLYTRVSITDTILWVFLGLAHTIWYLLVKLTVLFAFVISTEDWVLFR